MCREMEYLVRVSTNNVEGKRSLEVKRRRTWRVTRMKPGEAGNGENTDWSRDTVETGRECRVRLERKR